MRYHIRHLARQTGYSPSHISRVLRGKSGASLICLQKLSHASNVPFGVLIKNILRGDGETCNG